MATVREQFHAIANWHNKITIAAGCTKELLKEKPLTSLSPEELKAQQENIIAMFEKIENDAVGADKTVTELKAFIYNKIDPETNF